MLQQKSIQRFFKEKQSVDKENSSRTYNCHPLPDKPKKTPSRQHDISCDQIIKMAKRKLATSMHDLSSHSTSMCVKGGSGSLKSKMKQKKKENKQKKGKGKNVVQHKAPVYERQNHQENVNYPLSASNSFILFSEKQETINSMGFKSKLLENKIKYKMKPNQAAVIIQKHWRGYMTRKLLQQYISDEEEKLKKVANLSLSQLKSQTELHFSSIKSRSSSKVNRDPAEEIHEDVFRQKHTFFSSNGEIPLSPSLSQSQISQKTAKMGLHSNIVNEKIAMKEDSQSEEESQSSLFLFEHFKLRMCSNLQFEMDSYKKRIKANLDEEVIDFDEMLQKCQNGRKLMNEIKLTLSHIESQINNFTQQIGLARKEEQNIAELPVTQFFMIDVPTQQLSPHKKRENGGEDMLLNFLMGAEEEIEEKEISETEYFCEVLKKKTEAGAQNMIERCFIQIIVEILTNNFQVKEMMQAIENLSSGTDCQLKEVLVKWIDELNKWELGIIEEVQGNMEESTLIA